jgi:hypothetical protein
MAVVINEFEVSPAAAEPPKQEAGKAADDGGKASPDLLRQIEKAVQAKELREHRLTAY